jgi:hypothetical protein
MHFNVKLRKSMHIHVLSYFYVHVYTSLYVFSYIMGSIFMFTRDMCTFTRILHIQLHISTRICTSDAHLHVQVAYSYVFSVTHRAYRALVEAYCTSTRRFTRSFTIFISISHTYSYFHVHHMLNSRTGVSIDTFQGVKTSIISDNLQSYTRIHVLLCNFTARYEHDDG